MIFFDARSFSIYIEDGSRANFFCGGVWDECFDRSAAEGTHVLIVSDSETILIHRRRSLDYNVVKLNRVRLIRELLPALKKHFRDWIFWRYDSEDLTSEQIETRSNRLRDLLPDCEDALERS